MLVFHNFACYCCISLQQAAPFLLYRYELTVLAPSYRGRSVTARATSATKVIIVGGFDALAFCILKIYGSMNVE